MSWSSASSAEKRHHIGELIDRGRSYREICAEMGLCKGTVAYHARRLGIPAKSESAVRYDWDSVRSAIDRGASRIECMRAFGFSSASWYSAVEAGRIVPNDHRIPLSELLVVGRVTNRTSFKGRLYEAGLKSKICERCGITEWQGEPMALQLHHVNGRGDDNRLENLEILCPNCHAQTDTWGGRNKRRADAEAA